MIKIYEDSNWKIQKLSKFDEINSIEHQVRHAIPYSVISRITHSSIYIEIINKQSFKNGNITYVITDIGELPVRFYYLNNSSNKILDISEVTEFVPLQILSKVFKYIKELEPKFLVENFKLLLHSEWDRIRGNYEIDNNILEIKEFNDSLGINMKFNDKRIFLKINNVEVENDNLKISGKLKVPGKPDFNFQTKLPYFVFTKGNVDDFKKLIKKIIENNLDNLTEYSPKKEYQTFSLSKAGRGSASFTFGRLPDKSGKRTLQFIQYIKNKTSNGECATTKGFLESINKPTYSGYLSSFFSAIYNAGLVDREKNPSGSSKYCYVLGKNYQAWVEGRLKKIRG